ncbi:MAG: hypothetical protein K6G46_06755, partial [Prevotella sp.]|nr:hypothetical protein [Prevotella sp.]
VFSDRYGYFCRPLQIFVAGAMNKLTARQKLKRSNLSPCFPGCLPLFQRHFTPVTDTLVKFNVL